MFASNDNAFPIGVFAARASARSVSAFVRNVVILFLVWTAIGAFLALPLMFSKFSWWDLLAKVIEAWAWALVTPVILLINRRLGRFTIKPYHRAGILLLLSIPIVIIHTYLTAFLQLPFSDIWYNPLRVQPIDFYVYYFLNGWLTYCAFIGALLALDYYRSYLSGQVELERIEKRLIESHLNTLRMQLEPHFLFNALNAISSELASNPELARDMIEDLGALLRLSLDYKDNLEIPLADEIVLLEHYLAIQRVRFGDRIEIEISVPSEIMTVLVPSLLLQPIVENAIRHGISNRISGGQVVVSAQRVDDLVEILVQDDGVGLPPNWQMDSAKGLGVRVTRERLAGLYPGIVDSFDIRNRASGGTEAVMRVPMRTVGAE